MPTAAEAAMPGPQLTDKQKAARAIKWGCAAEASDLKSWKGSPASKPSLGNLKEEVRTSPLVFSTNCTLVLGILI